MAIVTWSDVLTRVGTPHNVQTRFRGRGGTPHIFKLTRRVVGSAGSARSGKSQHVLHTVRYQCNECEFMANLTETLNVHFVREHSPKHQTPM